MRTVKMTTLIGDSFNRTAEILFRPFSAKKWLRLVLIALLAGALFGSSGIGGGNGGRSNSADEKKPASTVSQDEKKAAADGSAGAAAGEAARKTQSPEEASRDAVIMKAVIASLAALAALVIFSFFFMTWLGARFKFVWLNAVINNTSDIMEPFSRHKREGNSFFRLSLTMGSIFILVAAFLLGWVIYGMAVNGMIVKESAWTLTAVLNVFVVPIIIGVLFFIIYLLLAFVLEQFVVPIMAFDRCTVMQGLGRFGAVLKGNKRDFTLFILVFFLLSIVAGTLAGILAFFAVVLIILAAAVLFGVPFILLWLVFKAKMAFVIYAVIAGIPAGIAALVFLFSMSLPFAVFFRVFSLKYLLSLGAGYGPESLERFSAAKAERISGKAPIVAGVAVMVLFLLIFIGGILAAVAVPNFVKAHQAAVEREKGLEGKEKGLKGAPDAGKMEKGGAADAGKMEKGGAPDVGKMEKGGATKVNGAKMPGGATGDDGAKEEVLS